MAVNIDPSEVRRNGTSVKPSLEASRPRFPLRVVFVGGLGGVALIAFTVGAFSFFSGLANPRARTPRSMPIAAKMPDLKDGIPVLAPEQGSGAGTQTASYNLPRPSPAEPQATQPDTAPPRPVQPRHAQNEPPGPPLRSAALQPESIVSEAHHEFREDAKASGAAPVARATPSIQNAAVIRETPRPTALVPPAKAETVKAKVGQASTFVSLPAEAKPQRHSESAAQEAQKSAKPPVQRTGARPKPALTKTVVEAAPAQVTTAPARSADDGDMMSAVPGGQQIRAGLKAIGGMFGGSEAD